ncbi:MAG: carboxypeptidase regulatory-like domain-containing protein [Gemmatimonadota bacterium]
MRAAFLTILSFSLLSTSPGFAQIGTATDIITGVISDSAGRPLQEATVEAFSLETQVTRSATTNQNGRYTILFTDGGGQYRMTARAMGMSAATQMLYRLGEEDRLVWNAGLAPHAVVLEEITVRGDRRRVTVPDPPTPGSSERSFSADNLSRLPLDVTDLNNLAALVPGVVSLAGTDSSAAAFSVAGLGPDANALTLDGLLYGTGLVPQDGIRNTRVVTNTYDVARGQFSGGLVAVTTRSGSNVVQGSANYSLRDQALSVGSTDSPFNQGTSQNTLSGGIGGPLIHNRLFAFASGQGRLRSDRLPSLLSATSTDLERLGANPDSVDRFMTLLSSEGLSPTDANAANRDNNNYSGLLRLDYLLSDAHTLSLRGDWQGTSQDPTRIGLTSLPQTGGTISTSGGGGMATLTSRFGVAVINEVRAYLSSTRRDGDPFLRLPSGRIQVASDLSDGTQGITTLTFGANQSLPSRSSSTTFEAADELSWLPGDGAHRIKIGTLLDQRKASDILSTNQFGTFSYNSLADFEADQPASFSRTLAPTRRESSALDYALYAGDTWRLSRALQLTYGLRFEGTDLGDAPRFNPAVDSVFGRRTDKFPTDQHVSPRVGFNYILGSNQPGTPGLIVRGGVGEFRSQIPPNLSAAAVSSTGLPSSETQIVCIGSDVPAPDWTSFQQDPSTIPTACLNGGGGSTVQPLRNVTLFGNDFAAPRAWRGSLGVQRPLTGLIRFSIDASYARGVSQTGFQDLNLRTTPAFSLANEGNRPVFVPSSQIFPQTGAVGLAGSRVDTTFGHVLEVGSQQETDSKQLTLGLSGITRSGIILNASYTLTDASNSSTGVGFGNGTTAGNPNQSEWASSDFQRRHGFLFTTMIPFGRALEVTTIARLNSGAPFTPVIGSDVNGDGYRNDRAFIFGPGAPAPVSSGIQNLISAAPGRVQSCLKDQLGQIAGRNSCIGPWQASLDLQFNWRPSFWGLDRKLSVQLVTSNLLGGLDQLFHGSDNLHGWGQNQRPDPTLLFVDGYDPNTQTFLYSVNGRFGATGGNSTAIRSPFQIGIQARLTIGPDRARQALDEFRGGRGGGGGGPGGGRGFSPADMLSRLRQAWINPARAVLNGKDSLGLGLSLEQASRIALLADSVDAKQEALISALQAELEKAGSAPDPQRLFASLQPRFQEGMKVTRDVTSELKNILTAEQWAKVPETIKNPMSRFGGGRRGPPQ